MLLKQLNLFAKFPHIVMSPFSTQMIILKIDDILITELNLTRKQYYSGMSGLIRAGLVKRQRGRYLLTAFGKVIYSAQMSLDAKIESALSNYWKLKAIDSMEMPSREENGKVISMYFQEIKDILSRIYFRKNKMKNHHPILLLIRTF